MTKVAVEHTFTGNTQQYSAGYNPALTNLGQWIVQKSGPVSSDNYAGPAPTSALRLFDALGANFTAVYPYAIDLGNGTHAVFLIENSTTTTPTSGTFPSLTAAAAANVVTATTVHNWTNGQPVIFTGASWTTISLSTIYYIRVGTTNSTTTFTVYDTLAHALATGSTGQATIGGSGFVYPQSRRVVLALYNTTTQVWMLKGWITLTPPNSAWPVVRGLAVQRHLYTTGTANTGGAASSSVTGEKTTWSASGYAAGARIGFGSVDPNQITNWYYISSINSDTSITLTGTTAAIIPYGSPYVIDELRVYYSQSTLGAAGLYVAKGINFDTFVIGGTVIPPAAATDNLQAVYWLKDASGQTNTQPGGLMLSPTYSDASQMCYVPNTTSSLKMYTYDVRKILTVSSGISTSAFQSSTGTILAASLSQDNAWTIATTNHGPGVGVSTLYGAFAAHLVRIPESMLAQASAVFTGDEILELPPLGANAYPVTGAMKSIKYISGLDRFVVSANSGSHAYLLQYKGDGSAYDRVFGSDTKQLDQAAANPGSTPFPLMNTTNYGSFCGLNGICYMARTQAAGTGTPPGSSNQLYAIPMGADWDVAAGTSASNQNRLITPELLTPGCQRFYRAIVSAATNIGSNSLGLSPEPYRLYYRTSGISDNSGTWYPLSENGDISGVGSAHSIQFMFEFRTVGLFAVVSRIYGLTCTYEDSSQDGHFQPSASHSSLSTKSFAWRFANAFGGTVPTLIVRLYEATTGTLLLKDTTASPSYGTFQKTTDGINWGANNSTDKVNETTYIRYTPTVLADNLKVQIVLSQY